MSDVISKALKKIADLQAQISELKRFIEMHRALEAEVADRQSSLGADEDELSSARNAQEYETIPVENLGSKRRRGTKPSDIVEMVERIIRDVGRPMTRGELVRALEQRDAKIPYEDKGRYVGTIVWRHKGLFENIEGRGYWLRGEPIPPTAPADLPENPGLPDIDDDVPY
ncbi:hypothetical protein ACUSIJ_24790 [Pseudochelatococcus sp. B33]